MAHPPPSPSGSQPPPPPPQHPPNRSVAEEQQGDTTPQSSLESNTTANRRCVNQSRGGDASAASQSDAAEEDIIDADDHGHHKYTHKYGVEIIENDAQAPMPQQLVATDATNTTSLLAKKKLRVENRNNDGQEFLATTVHEVVQDEIATSQHEVLDRDTNDDLSSFIAVLMDVDDVEVGRITTNPADDSAVNIEMDNKYNDIPAAHSGATSSSSSTSFATSIEEAEEQYFLRVTGRGGNPGATVPHQQPPLSSLAMPPDNDQSSAPPSQFTVLEATVVDDRIYDAVAVRDSLFVKHHELLVPRPWWKKYMKYILVGLVSVSIGAMAATIVHLKQNGMKQKQDEFTVRSEVSSTPILVSESTSCGSCR